MIKAGDIVSVHFNNSRITLCENARVDHVPCATGDSWLFTDIDTENEHCVSEGCTITKRI